LFAQGIFKVIYAPHKAFKEIIQNPRYIGPILIMLFFVLANVGFSYALLSKTFLDQTMPKASDLDKWTEDTAFWTSNANISLNTQDYINGTYYGNKSIQFSIDASSQVWMQLNISSSLSCSGPEGYKNLSFRLKITSIEPSATPSNVRLYMISTSPQDTFHQNVTAQLNQTYIWNNASIPVGNESPDWLSNASPDWGNITGLRLEFTWPTDSNVTLLIDGLFFHGLYKSVIDLSSSSLIGLGNPYSPINTFMQFIIQWVVLGGLLYVIPKMFGIKTVWKPLLIIAGFVLVTYFIRMIVFTGVCIASPEIRYPLKLLGGVSGEQETAYIQAIEPVTFAERILWYVDKLVLVWGAVLCAIALRLMFSISWAKSLLMSISSYALYIVLLIFLAPLAVLL